MAENPNHVPQPMLEKLANKTSFLQTKDNLVNAEQSIVVSQKRPGGELSEDLPQEKKSRTKEDLEQSLQLAKMAQGLERLGEAFTTQGQEKALREVDPHP